MRTEKSNRFIGFDILKFLCAFLVVCIHRPFPGIAGEYIIVLARIAVPIFFMITGFYYSAIDRKGNVDLQIKKILRLIIGSNLLYLVWNCFYEFISGSNVLGYLWQTFTFENVVELFIFNESPFSVHLWYLCAVFYVFLIAKAIKRIGGGYWKIAQFVVIPALLIGDLILGKYSLLLLGREFPYIIVRNWLFVGVPYFFIGIMLREKQSIAQRISIQRLGSLVVLFSLTTLCERFFLNSMNSNATRDHYISTTFLAVVIFLLFLDIYQSRTAGYFERWMANVGRKYSAWVYIIHPMFITVLAIVMRKIGFYDVYCCVAPIVVYGISIMFVAFMSKLFTLYKSRF